MHALGKLRNHGLTCKALHDVARASTIAQVMYASPAWGDGPPLPGVVTPRGRHSKGEYTNIRCWSIYGRCCSAEIILAISGVFRGWTSGLLIAVAPRYRYCSGATFTVAVAVAPLLLAESSGDSSAATFLAVFLALLATATFKKEN